MEELRKSQQVVQNSEETGEIDLLRLFHQLQKNIRFIIISTVILATIAGLISTFFLSKKYASDARIYVSPKVSEEGFVDYTSVYSGEAMVKNYVSILQGENLLTTAANNLGISPMLLSSSLKVRNSEDTQIISISSTTKDPLLSKRIVEEVVNVFREDMQEELNIQNLLILDSPKVSKLPVSPNLKKNIVLGGLLGMMVSCGFIVIRYLLDKRLKNKEEAENYLQIPVLAEIPYIEE